MSRERANDLARTCTELVREGKDFPSVWASVLKSHLLVEGIPRSKIEETRTLLEVPLITGERLVFYSDTKEFAVG
jgi:hypothetical protein